MKGVEIGVVVPVYNAERTLLATLESIEQQRFPPKELIIVNDGSSDASEKIIQDFASRSTLKIATVFQENKGLGAARNKGWKASSCNWIAFLDADDLWDEDKLKRLQLEIQQKGDGVYYHSMRPLEGGRIRQAKKLKSLEDVLLKGRSPVPSSVLMSRSLLESSGGFTEDKAFLGAEDLHLWLRLLMRSTPFYGLNELLGEYRAGGMSSEIGMHSERVRAVLNSLADELSLSEAYLKKVEQRLQYEWARAYHTIGELEKAIGLYKKAGWSLKIVGFRLACLLRLVL